MQVDLISTTKSSTKVVHGTENGKRTACGINLLKPENVGSFTKIGIMSDVIDLTCEKCKTVIAKKLIRESNREMAAQLKEEQKALKRERAAAKHHHGQIPEPEPVRPQQPAPGAIPPSMRRQMSQAEQPIDTPPPPRASAPTPMPAPNVAPTPLQKPAASANDVLAQFAIPGVPGAAPASVPPAMPAPAPAPAPAPVPANDVLAQFALPTVPTAPAAPSPVPANDVLAQFAIPGVPAAQPAPAPAPAPARAPIPQNDVLAQFALPNVPSAPAAPAAPQPASANADDILAQFNTGVRAPVQPQTGDLLAQFSQKPPVSSLDSLADSLFTPNQAPAPAPMQTVPTVPAVPTVPTAPAAPSVPTLDEVSPLLHKSAAAPEPVVDVQPMPAANGFNPYAKPAAPAAPILDSIDDILVMPGRPAPKAPSVPTLDVPEIPTVPTVPTAPAVPQSVPTLNVPEVPTVPTVPTAPAAPQPVPALNVPTVPTVPTAPAAPQGVPTLNVPEAPAAPVAPVQMPYPSAAVPQGYPTAPQGFAVPMPGAIPATVPGAVYPGGFVQPMVGYPYMNQPAANLYAVPKAPKKEEPNTPTPLFVGYSADGRQLFQTYDAAGNPIPINEPVYSAPPETSNTPVSAPVAPAAQAAAPVMDMDELMASMGIQDPSKRKVDEGKAINYTEYHIPDKKKKKPASAMPAAAKPEEPTGPISAAEAKRRKKVDKINREFEKQLRARGIDPRTGGIMMDPKK